LPVLFSQQYFGVRQNYCRRYFLNIIAPFDECLTKSGILYVNNDNTTGKNQPEENDGRGKIEL